MSQSPASALINANLPASQAVYYDRVAVEALFATLAFKSLTVERTLPMKSGKTIQLFGYDLAPFATASVSAGGSPSTASEGTVGTGLTPTQSKITAVLGQYADYVNCSDFLLDVAIDDELEGLSKMLGYRAGLLSDTLVQAAFDAAIATDASAGPACLADGTYLTGNVIRTNVSSLEGRNVHPFSDIGKYRGVIHPFASGDLFNDNSNNGVVDVMKHTPDFAKIVVNGTVNGSKYDEIEWAGVRFRKSTNVPLYANTPSAGHSAYGTYIAGDNAMFSIGLGKTEIPKENNFQANILRFAPSSFDPAGQIGGAVSYNFKQVVSPRTGTTMGFRRIQAESAIS